MQAITRADQNAATCEQSNPGDSFSIAAVRKQIVGVIQPAG